MTRQDNPIFSRTDEPGRRTIAIIGADAILGMDLRMVLSEAGFELEEYAGPDRVPSAFNSWSSAIIDIGKAADKAFETLARLAEAQIPYVVVSCANEDLPKRAIWPQMRGHLQKPFDAGQVLTLL